jgi:hypothetical protein
MAPAYRVHVEHVGVARHERDEHGRLFFPRCESTKTDCRARPDHVARFTRFGPCRETFTRVCRYHAEELTQ